VAFTSSARSAAPADALIWNGVTWKTARLARAGDGLRTLALLACGSPHNCAAIGTYRPAGTSRSQPVAEHWNGSACLHTVTCDTVVCMAQVDRFSVTMPPELGEGVRQAAARQGTSVSTWLTEAAADKLRNELLGAALDQWEAEDGAFTPAELDAAASGLGLAPRADLA
jgi:hypothetical protein